MEAEALTHSAHVLLVMNYMQMFMFIYLDTPEKRNIAMNTMNNHSIIVWWYFVGF